MEQSQANAHWCESLYLQKADGLLLYGRALGLSHAEAEDVLQETFVAMVQLAEAPENRENYCFRSYRNRALNYRRGIWRRFMREFESRRWFEMEPSTEEAEFRAMQCLAALPSEQREIIVLKIWNRMTFEAIAEMLELSPHTVAGRYRYGMNKLRVALELNNYERVRPLREALAVMDPTSPIG